MPLLHFPLNRFVPTRSLFVAKDGVAFAVGGEARIDMSAKGPLRRILVAMVTAHRASPTRGLSVAEVFRAGWRDEVVTDPDVMSGRVYSAISKLKRLGLTSVLQRTEAGYQLDPRCCVIEEMPRIRTSRAA
jgi:hypothetical protein